MNRTFSRAISACILVLVLIALMWPSESAARIVAEAPLAGGGSIVLHDQAGPCVGGALLAQHITVAGDITPGCWIKRPGHVAIVFLDGDVGAVPEGALQKPRTS